MENLPKVIVFISTRLIDHNHVCDVAANVFRRELVFIVRVKWVAPSFLVYLEVQLRNVCHVCLYGGKVVQRKGLRDFRIKGYRLVSQLRVRKKKRAVDTVVRDGRDQKEWLLLIFKYLPVSWFGLGRKIPLIFSSIKL
jgi:hypothetical protein